MKESKELAKKNWKGSGDSAVDDIWFGIKDKLIEKMAPKVSSLKIGPWDDPEAEMGPIVTKESYDRITKLIGEGEKLVQN